MRRRVLLIALGSLAAATAIGVVLGRGESDGRPTRIDRADGSASTCFQSATVSPAATGTSHPSRRFAGPGDEVEGVALAHVVADGFVVVFYRPSLPAREREQVRSWVEGTELAVFAAPSRRQREHVRAVTRERQIRCSRVDLGGLTAFRDTWLREQLTKR